MKRAFTMLELVFVIVVLGILAGIAAPRLFATRDDAIIARARADIASIRSAITNMRNTNMLTGNFAFPALEGTDNSTVFDNVLQNGIKPKGSSGKSGWTASANNYTFTLGSQTTIFTYNQANGSFTCPNTDKLCRNLTE